jgi:putative sensory transduction regulator
VPGIAETIERFFTAAEIPFKRVSDTEWGAQLRGERKLTIPLGIAISGDRVLFESFFMRRPQENADRFYEMLLRRNARAFGVHFAVDAQGDVFLVGGWPAEALTEDALDRIVGSVLIESDGLFEAAINIGFETYFKADMAWRARGGS